MNDIYLKEKSTMRIICFAVIILMAFSVLPSGKSTSVNADASIGTADDIVVDTSGTTQTVYYGSSDSSIKWRVVTKDANTMTLFCDGAVSNSMAYDNSEHNNWTGSRICKWLNKDFLDGRFTGKETDAITTYSSVEEAGYNPSDTFTPNQKVVLPSVAEVSGSGSGTWNMSVTDREYSDYWWLRSPGFTDINAAVVGADGYVNDYGYYVDDNYAVRPALKLNLNSVLFTSDASKASKTAASGSSLQKISSVPTSAALTLTDEDLSLTADTTSVSGITGSSVEIDYSDATTGSGMSVSVMICDDSDKMLYYGRPVDLSADNAESSGTAEIDIPDDLDAGDYTIKIFNEQVNDEYLTDYASVPDEVELTVEEYTEAPTITNPTTTLSVEAGKSGSLDVIATGTPTPTFSAVLKDSSPLPDWISIDETTGKITATPATSQTAEDTVITVTASNGVAPDATKDFTITVTGAKSTVTFNKNGGEHISFTTKEAIRGDNYGDMPVVTRAGYNFEGWYTQETGGNEVTAATTVTAVTNHSIHAQWTMLTTPPEITTTDTVLTVEAGKSGSLDVTATGTPTPTFSAVLSGGGDLPNWISIDETTGKITATPATSQTAEDTVITVTASNGVAPDATKDFTIKVTKPPVADKFTVTLNVNGGKKLSNNKITVTNGKTYGNLPTPKRTGYKFKGWYTAKSGGTLVTSSKTVNLKSDQTLYAQWIANKYNVTFMGNKGKIKKFGKYRVSKLTKKMTYGKKYGSLPKAKRTGYKFKGWYTKKSGGMKVTSKTVMNSAKNKTLYARWTPNAVVANCKWVHMRKSPGVSKTIKKYVKKGTKVAIIGKVKLNGKYTWYKVKIGKKTGYIYFKYVKRV